jgi:uncharacterized protein (DUF2235 family)
VEPQGKESLREAANLGHDNSAPSQAQRKNIVICCDGTGNEFGDANSNVVKLYSTLIINQSQVGYYHPGVGTMGAPTARGRIEKEWTRLKGLAFGGGLLDNVSDAYRYLMDVYADGDRIYLFGFSRGAYTVRALGGVLHMFGLLCPGNHGHIPYIMRMYAARRRKAGRQKATANIDHEFKYTFARDIRLHFVGVWDTVSSVGWIYDPIKLPFAGQNPIIAIGRQALSIHERRCFFQPMLWTEPERDQSMKQVWFAGVHSDVGGSYPEKQSGLSKLALEWMLHEAAEAGLQLDVSRVECVLGKRCSETFAHPYVPPDPNGLMHESLKGLWWLLELLPHRYDPKPASHSGERWRIPLGAHRELPNRSRIYELAVPRIDPNRAPANFVMEARTGPFYRQEPAS